MMVEGKTALVTGGSGGLGRCIVSELVRQGAKVLFTYSKSKEEAERLVKQLNVEEERVYAVCSDAVNFTAAGETVKFGLELFGNLDILINNVGGSGSKEGPIWSITEEEWDSVINTNLKSCFNYTKAVVPSFMSRKSGTIINIGSINGLRGREGQPAYTAAKGGVTAFTKTLAKELGLYNITVNMVATGYMNTDKNKIKVSEAYRRTILNLCAIKELVEPEEVAATVGFLCSDLAKHITGNVIRVDSGEYI